MNIHSPGKSQPDEINNLQNSALFEADEQIKYFTTRLDEIYMAQLMTPQMLDDQIFAMEYSKLKSEFDNLLFDLEQFYNGKLLLFENLQTDLVQSESHRVAAQIHKIAYDQAFILSKAEQNFYMKSSKMFQLTYAAQLNSHENDQDTLLH